jgi:hypothetical protein
MRRSWAFALNYRLWQSTSAHSFTFSRLFPIYDGNKINISWKKINNTLAPKREEEYKKVSITVPETKRSKEKI